MSRCALTPQHALLLAIAVQLGAKQRSLGTRPQAASTWSYPSHSWQGHGHREGSAFVAWVCQCSAVKA